MSKCYRYPLVLFILSSFIGCGKKQSSDNIVPTDSIAKQDTKQAMRVLKIDARKIGPDKSSEQSRIEDAIRLMNENKNLEIVGYWVGTFGHNKINIALAGITNDQAIGYTVCAGNYRPITGQVNVQGDSIYIFDMDEPGTDPYDGHFQFVIDTEKKTLEGSWSPFKKGSATAKKFNLTKQEYTYRTNVGNYPQASDRLLTEIDVENMLEEELAFMRNEIYARHGYSFKDKAMRSAFDTTSWYIPMGIDIRENLTDVEVQNIDLIYQYEEYYAENYDSYGR